MQVRVLFFASAREAAKCSATELDVPRGALVRDLRGQLGQEIPALAAVLQQCRIAVDMEFATDATPLREGCEVAVVPPVSGGHDGPDAKRGDRASRVLETPLSLDAVLRAVEHPSCGAVATFTGNVRRRSRDTSIERLEYEAYVPMACKVMDDIARAVEARLDGVRVAVHHRIGSLDVGETAVVIAAAAPHRAEAFEACREVIEQLKREVPIWKREIAEDGRTWFGRGP